LLIVHHQHRAFELRGSSALDVEPALRTRLRGIRILGPTVRAEHSATYLSTAFKAREAYRSEIALLKRILLSARA
jgi:hypothetical protein